MNVPQTMRIYCNFCKKHTTHTVELAKKRPRRSVAQGQRRYLKKLEGYGSFPRPKPDHEKTTKKVDLRYLCKECGKKHTKGQGFRAKKFQIVKV
ncbi:MAG: 50S ribosomal protein L44e [Candidatus Aenigmarchaeota archaeon]|nr:50S ribosomal protein L44e [Candidatus Aenigmarchaeota archaeon]